MRLLSLSNLAISQGLVVPELASKRQNSLILKLKNDFKGEIVSKIQFRTT
jgi:hypothetical protein